MTWCALRAEIALEYQQLAPTMWDAWAMHTPTRNEEARKADARAETSRKIATLHAVGKVRQARKAESYQRAWKRRKAKR